MKYLDDIQQETLKNELIVTLQKKISALKNENFKIALLEATEVAKKNGDFNPVFRKSCSDTQCLDITKFLYENEIFAVSIDAAGTSGKNALAIARHYNKHEEEQNATIMYLLQKEIINELVNKIEKQENIGNREILLKHLHAKNYNLVFRNACLYAGNLDILNFLCNNKEIFNIDINEKASTSGKTALDLAIEKGHELIIVLLMKQTDLKVSKDSLDKIFDKYGANLIKNFIKRDYDILAQELDKIKQALFVFQTNHEKNEDKYNFYEYMAKASQEFMEIHKVYKAKLAEYLPFNFAYDNLLRGNELSSLSPVPIKQICQNHRKIYLEAEKIVDQSLLNFIALCKVLKQNLKNDNQQLKLRHEVLAKEEEEETKKDVDQGKELAKPEISSEPQKLMGTLLKQMQLSKKSQKTQDVAKKNTKLELNTKELEREYQNVQKQIKHIDRALDQLNSLKNVGAVKRGKYNSAINDIRSGLEIEGRKTTSGFSYQTSDVQLFSHRPHSDKGIDKKAVKTSQELAMAGKEKLEEKAEQLAKKMRDLRK